MRKRLCTTVLACVAIIAALLPSMTSAAVLAAHNAGASARIGPVHNVIVGGRFAPLNPLVTVQDPHHGPKYDKPQWKWVCGPLLNYDGTWHCHWVKH